MLKHLKTKDPVQLRLEHLEQGFSVYVNGANSELKTSPRRAIHADFTRSASHAEGTHGEQGPVRARQRANSSRRNQLRRTQTSQQITGYPVHASCAHWARESRAVRKTEKSFFFPSKSRLGLHYPRAEVARAVNSWLLCFIVPVIEGNV